MDHIRDAHNVPEEIRKVSLEIFPPWTVTRQVYAESPTTRYSDISSDVFLFNEVGLSLVHQPVRVMDPPIWIAPRLTVQDPLMAAGAVVFDCRPPFIPVSLDVTGIDMPTIRSSVLSAEADVVSPEREQSFGGGGGRFA